MKFKFNILFSLVLLLVLNFKVVECANMAVPQKKDESIAQLSELLKETRAKKYAKELQEAFDLFPVDYSKFKSKMGVRLCTTDFKECNCILWINSSSLTEKQKLELIKYSVSIFHKCNHNYLSKIINKINALNVNKITSI